MNALVMYDHQTNTLWSQFLRKGVKGELKGVELGVVPATQTTWAAWAELHPDTLVLDKGSAYTVDSYERYYTDSGRSGIHGQFNPDDRLPPKELVVGKTLTAKQKHTRSAPSPVGKSSTTPSQTKTSSSSSTPRPPPP